MSADSPGVDPFARTQRTSERVITLSTRAALAASLIYLAWRAVFTTVGADHPAGALLLAAEILAVVVFAARVRSARTEPIAVVATPDAPHPDTAAVVDATGTSIDELRTTLVSLRRVSGVERVIVVDREGSRWLRTIAERFDAVVMEQSVTFDEAVQAAGTSWVLLLRSGDLPMPDLVSVSASRCSSPDVAVVQVGVEEADPTSFEHDPDGHWSLEPFDQQVVRPSLARRGSIPWYGDGPALVRRSAVGPSPERPARGDHMLDDSRRVGLDIVRAGMTVTHLPLTLARVRGPHGLGESLVRRHQRARQAIRALTPGNLRGVDRKTRNAHLLALVSPLAAIQRVLLVAAAVCVLGFAQVPMDAALFDVVLLAAPSYLLRWNSHLLIGRGRLGPFSILRSELRSLGVDLLPFGRVRAEANRNGLTAIVVAVVALDVAVVVAALSMWRDWPNRLPGSVAALAFVLTAGFLGVAMEVLLDALARRQRRAGHRVRLGLVTCRVEEHDGQLVDLSTGGAGVVVAAPIEETLEVGEVTTVSFRIPDADGAWKNVSALVHVAHRTPDPDGGTRLGLTFDDPTDAPLDPVVEFLTIDRRLVALGRHETANL
ncbi:MAG: PilZ domain-containing protein [Acidimicrobiales bacterium]|nr:PilZ domain-containing protein [Acidimicrobiales bacterium]